MTGPELYLYDSSVKLKLVFPRSVMKLTFCISRACLTSDDFPISLKRRQPWYRKSIMALNRAASYLQWKIASTGLQSLYNKVLRTEVTVIVGLDPVLSPKSRRLMRKQSVGSGIPLIL